MATWQEFVRYERDFHGDASDVVHLTPAGVDLTKGFDAGYGGTEGQPFTLWTHERVYFPTEYDGAESVASVPRNPCDEVTEHI